MRIACLAILQCHTVVVCTSSLKKIGCLKINTPCCLLASCSFTLSLAPLKQPSQRKKKKTKEQKWWDEIPIVPPPLPFFWLCVRHDVAGRKEKASPPLKPRWNLWEGRREGEDSALIFFPPPPPPLCAYYAQSAHTNLITGWWRDYLCRVPIPSLRKLRIVQ